LIHSFVFALLLVFLFSGTCGSCIGYVDGNYVGSQHLYSEALWAFRMNVDLPGLRRWPDSLIFSDAYQHFSGERGINAYGYVYGAGHECGVGFHVYNVPFALAGAVF
jgi:hypothetical protein